MAVALTTCRNPRPVKPVKISSSVDFRCLWWSPEQMNGLDPDAPPPKATEVILQKWEYSDPVGVPHPDLLDVVVTVTNDSDIAVTNVAINVSVAWKIGNFKDERRSDWTPITTLEDSEPFSLEAHETKVLRVSVNLAEKITELNKTNNWPYTLRAKAKVTKKDASLLLAVSQAELPIIAGD